MTGVCISVGMETEAKTKRVLHLACCMLPKPNRDVMHLLCLFLKWVASFKDKNKMDIQNLALIFTPTILYAPPSKDLPTARAQQQSSAQDEIQVITLLIRYQAEFCKVMDKIRENKAYSIFLFITIIILLTSWIRYPQKSCRCCKIQS